VIIRDLDRIGSPLFLNFLRASTGAVLYIITLVVLGLVSEFFMISLIVVFYLLLSVVFNVVVGDTFFFKSQTILGVKTATPIVNIYPFVTIVLSVVFLSEEFEDRFLIGGLMIILGVILLSQEINQEEVVRNGFSSKDKLLAFLLAFGAVIMYALGVFYTTLGSRDLNVNVANSVRLPSGTIILLLILIIQPNQINSKKDSKISFRDQLQELWEVSSLDKFKIIIAGILGTYISSLFLVLSTQELGAGKTAVLTSTGPLFALPLAIFWLKEKVGKYTIIGTILSLIGLWISIT
jgi:drug/metabolite transporter (DMT)-like permease